MFAWCVVFRSLSVLIKPTHTSFRVTRREKLYAGRSERTSLRASNRRLCLTRDVKHGSDLRLDSIISSPLIDIVLMGLYHNGHINENVKTNGVLLRNRDIHGMVG